MTTLQERIAAEMDAQKRTDLLLMQKRVETTNRLIALLQFTKGELERDIAGIVNAHTRVDFDANHIDIRA